MDWLQEQIEAAVELLREIRDALWEIRDLMRDGRRWGQD